MCLEVFSLLTQASVSQGLSMPESLWTTMKIFKSREELMIAQGQAWLPYLWPG